MRLLLCVIACAFAVIPFQGAAADHTMDWYTIDGGGGVSIGGGHVCVGTFGQPDANEVTMAGSAFQLDGGFWLSGTPTCPGDVNGDGFVNSNDIISLLAMWGWCGNCPQDLDGDGSVGANDLVILLASWGPCS